MAYRDQDELPFENVTKRRPSDRSFGNVRASGESERGIPRYGERTSIVQDGSGWPQSASSLPANERSSAKRSANEPWGPGADTIQARPRNSSSSFSNAP